MEIREIPELRGYFATDEGHILTNWEKKYNLVYDDYIYVQGSDLVKVPERMGTYYLTVSIYFIGFSRDWPVHQLIATAFHGIRPAKDTLCRHLDGNPHNNCPSNLRWGTYQDNANDRVIHGSMPIGSKHHSNKIPEHVVLEALSLPRVNGKLFGGSLARLSREHNVDPRTLSAVACARRKREEKRRRLKSSGRG